jgi:pimeloyl-ACP methyl ester carboxylesterase
MKLFYRKSGEGPPLIILHGLFGSSDNWYSLSKKFAEHFTTYLVDQRNHGQSPPSDEMDYKLLTTDLHEFINDHELTAPIVIGHSMGGKTAMNFAIKFPDLVSKLIVVDIMPKKYPIHHDHILDGLMAIHLDELSSRNEADRVLAEYVPELEVRQFLLKNLARDKDNRFVWKINLAALNKHIEDLGEGLQYGGQYQGPALFVKGAKSNYFSAGDEKKVMDFFPSAKIETINTGHWVQAENPKGFMDIVLPFLEN